MVFHRQPLKVTIVPKGRRCCIIDPADIKQRCMIRDCLAAGTLSQMDLNAQANPFVDVSSIRVLVAGAKSVFDIPTFVGQVMINVDTWASDTATCLCRADKDGFVMAVCLLIYWHKDDPPTFDALSDYASDMAFMFISLGTGHVMMYLNVICL